MTTLRYRQVDVFAEKPLAGNGLAVFITQPPLGDLAMQELTRELRQFESIFLTASKEPGKYSARVFTMEEELPFAGHPAIGAGAVLHERAGSDGLDCSLLLPAGEVTLNSCRKGEHYQVSMNQGQVSFGREIHADDEAAWLNCFSLDHTQRDRRMPICIASTGLPYLVVPVTSDGLARARITDRELEERLAAVGAKFAYVFDVEQREGRTWDNSGSVEDIATGSAAGPIAGLLIRHSLAAAGHPFVLRQGRFVGRPSEMIATVGKGSAHELGDVILSGNVVMIAKGEFDENVSSNVRFEQ